VQSPLCNHPASAICRTIYRTILRAILRAIWRTIPRGVCRTICRRTVRTARQTADRILPQAIRQTVLQVIREAIRQRISETILQTIWKTIPRRVPQTIPYAGYQIAHSAPNPFPCRQISPKTGRPACILRSTQAFPASYPPIANPRSRIQNPVAFPAAGRQIRIQNRQSKIQNCSCAAATFEIWRARLPPKPAPPASGHKP
jgi:hypothetical protein